MENPVLPSSCVTPAGTSIEVQNEWEENTHTHTHVMVYYNNIVSGLFLMFCWCPCMAINVSVQYNDGLLSTLYC